MLENCCLFGSLELSPALPCARADHFEGADEKFAVKTGGIKEFDPLRDGPLRYLGYSNECGEAFAAWLPFWGVPFSYGVAISYVLVDTVDKGLKAYKEARTELDANASLHPEVDTPRLEKLLAVERSMDTVVWQLLASVICPGYTIHTVVALVHAGLLPIEQLEAVKEAVNALATSVSLQGDVLMAILDKSLPTASGLAAIPFIVHPIDNAIHALMNLTLRPAMRKYICGPGQGGLADLDMCIDCQVAADSSPSSTNGSKH
ncbi:probable mitochondrial fission process protein 1 [Coccomyxa sp. Obi]|nr:probable mitochondrial fission process protein 1 [Coccomyxa sp. Obi]